MRKIEITRTLHKHMKEEEEEEEEEEDDDDDDEEKISNTRDI